MPSLEVDRRTSLCATARAALGVLALSAAAVQGQQEGDDFELHGFSVYDSQPARALATSAAQHTAAGRWNEAVAELQQLIDDHKGDVLSGERPKLERTGRNSQQNVHRGAASHATQRLFELPPEARAIYRRRNADRASRALAVAIEGESRKALVDVARRWPLTEEAHRAWCALGDLEIELGNLGAGRRAWGRALARAVGRPEDEPELAADWSELLATLDGVEGSEDGPSVDLGRALRARIALVNSSLAAGLEREPGGEAGIGRAAATALDGHPAAGNLPGRSTDSWRKPFELPPHPYDIFQKQHNLFPARWGDALLVSTSLELLSVGAFSGSLLWRSGLELAGWDPNSPQSDHFEAVDNDWAIVAPAVAQGVAVATLQIPIAFESKISYGDMPIIKKLPNRRLFAFDVETGKPLWNTRPPEDWDGSSGDFSDRMRMVGPPTIAGSRVLVPAARLEGRIEFHVGCFDLFSGDLLWSTVVITGQRELNMFGRIEVEFSAPPLRVVGSRVINLTQLGTVASLDLFTGDILWQTVYDQIPLPASKHFRTGLRETKWDNVPPVIADGMVIATPHDSRELIALDLETGHMTWSLDHHSVQRQGPQGSDLRTLFGADAQHVYMSGNRVVALRSPAGIARGELDGHDWAFPIGGETLSWRNPSPVLGESSVFVPDQKALYEIDRSNGRRLQEIPWVAGGPGNLLVGDGVLFSLSPKRLTGYFEWQKLVDRARATLRRTPDDVGAVLSLAMLLEKRGTSEWEKGSPRNAERFLVEARQTLEPLLTPQLADTHPEVLAELHVVLLAEARAAKGLADTHRALQLFERARPLAPTREELRDTLLEEQALVRARDKDAWLERLQLLLDECGDLSMVIEARTEEARASDAAPRAWYGSLMPIVGSASEAERSHLRLPVGLWVLIERAELYSATRRSAEAFADLHAILDQYPEQSLFGMRAADWAARRIGLELEVGRGRGYEAFQARAAELFERAIAARDASLLARIPSLYPHSAAATRANDRRLEWALEAGDARAAIAIVLGEFDELWRMRDATPREVERLLALAQAVGGANPAFRAGLARALARHHAFRPAGRTGAVGGEEQTIAELAQSWSLPPAPSSAEADASFDLAVRTQETSLKGRFELLGEAAAPIVIGDAPSPVAANHVLVYADGGTRVIAFADDTPARPLWNLPILQPETPRQWTGRFATSAGRVHLATMTSVITSDRELGGVLWSWSADTGEVESVHAADGVLVAVCDIAPGRKQDRLFVGLEASTGMELWRLVVDHRAYNPVPVLGAGRVTLLPQQPYKRGEVHDLFTGRDECVFDLEQGIFDRDALAAWIQDERLIVPRFNQGTNPGRNHVFALDLDTGRESWRVDFSSGHLADLQLTYVVRHDEHTYLVLQPHSGGQRMRTGAIYELHPSIGSASSTPIAELADGEKPIGIAPRKRAELATPYLFILGGGPTDAPTLRAIHLPYGRRWEVELSVSRDALQTGVMPRPALSKSTVAFAWQERSSGREFSTHLAFFDRASGRRLEERTLSSALTGQSTVDLFALGDALMISGLMRMEILR